MPNFPTPQNSRYRRDYVIYKIKKWIAVSNILQVQPSEYKIKIADFILYPGYI